MRSQIYLTISLAYSTPKTDAATFTSIILMLYVGWTFLYVACEFNATMGLSKYVGCHGVCIPGTYTAIPTSAIPTPASPNQNCLNPNGDVTRDGFYGGFFWRYFDSYCCHDSNMIGCWIKLMPTWNPPWFLCRLTMMGTKLFFCS